MLDDLNKMVDYVKRSPTWRIRYVELPDVVSQFVDKSIKLLKLHGKESTSQNGTKHLHLRCEPLWFHSVGDGPHELYVTLPGPPEEPGLRVSVYESGPTGIRFDEQQCAQFLQLFNKWLVLDKLSEI